MKTKFILTAAVAALAATGVQAHHSFSMFDPSREEVVRGTVTQWSFNAPHTLLFIEDEEGTPWVFEGSAPPAVLARDPQMRGDTFQPGDEITVVHCPLRDGRSGGGVGIVVMADGTIYNPSDGGCGVARQTEQWKEWLAAGFTSMEEAKAAEGTGESEEEASD